VVAAPADQQLAFESPLAMITRDPKFTGVTDRIWASLRQQTGQEISAKIYQRNSSGTPSGAYSVAGEMFGFMMIGELSTNLTSQRSNPFATIQIDPGPDTVLELISELGIFTPSPGDIGQNLVNIFMIDEEFLAFSSATSFGTHIDLD
ncbi:MAG: hypothetical protein ACREA0_10785, partial [bacterium]